MRLWVPFSEHAERKELLSVVTLATRSQHLGSQGRKMANLKPSELHIRALPPTPAKKTNNQIKLSYTTNNIRIIGAYSGNVASVMC